MLKHENINSPLSQQVILYGEYEYNMEIKPKKVIKNILNDKNFENRDRISLFSHKSVNSDEQNSSNILKNYNVAETKKKSVKKE